MKKFIILFFIVALVISNNYIYGQYEKFKAVYIFNFTKYVEWTVATKQGNFIIGIFTDNPIKEHLAVIAQKRKVGNQPIEIKIFKTLKEIGRCNILFVPANQTIYLDEIINHLTNKDVLIITEKDGSVKKGSEINFYTEGGQLKYEFSEKNILRNYLKINSTFALFGKKIE